MATKYQTQPFTRISKPAKNLIAIKAMSAKLMTNSENKNATPIEEMKENHAI